jgi:hypothetical protein
MLIRLQYPDNRVIDPEILVRRAYMKELINSEQLDRGMFAAVKGDWFGVLDILSPGWREKGIPCFLRLPLGVVAEVL